MEEQEGMSQTLPDDLLEKIIALVPFPGIFKARGLSKSWLARFSSLSSLDDESKKSLAKPFQKEVSHQSRRWESFSLVFIGKEDLVAYNKASQDWRTLPRWDSLSRVQSLVNNNVDIAFSQASQNCRRLPSLSFLPLSILQGNLDRFLARSCVHMEGPLLYCINGPKSELHVANLLTRSWKQLPPPPNPRLLYILCHNLVVDPSSNTYQLILVCRQEGRTMYHHNSTNLCIRIYDSKSTSWTCKNFVVSAGFSSVPSTSVYLNGILYMVATNNQQNLLAINLEDGTFEELRLSIQDVTEVISVNLVVCKGDWLIMATKGLYPECLQVLKIDLGLLRLVQLAKGPPGQLLSPPVGDGNAVYFRIEHGASRVLRYDVDADEWSSFIVPTTTSAQKRKWIGSSFQPGLSPFVAV